jgi:hypothetical protein
MPPRDPRLTDDAVVADALRLLDHPAPRRSADDVLAEARRRPVARTPRRAWRLAAAVGLTVAGAAAALPSSPLRRLLGRALSSAPAAAPAAAPQASPAATPATAPETLRDAASAGVAVVPRERVEVAFLRPGAGHLEIRLVDERQLSLVPRGANVRFTVRPDRIAVEDTTGRASFELRVPRTVAQLRVEVGGATVFRVVDGAVVSRARRDDATGAYLIELRPPRP